MTVFYDRRREFKEYIEPAMRQLVEMATDLKIPIVIVACPKAEDNDETYAVGVAASKLDTPSLIRIIMQLAENKEAIEKVDQLIGALVLAAILENGGSTKDKLSFIQSVIEHFGGAPYGDEEEE